MSLSPYELLVYVIVGVVVVDRVFLIVMSV